MFKIISAGNIVEATGMKGEEMFSTLLDACVARLEELRTLVPEGAELEIDYNEQDEQYYACSYKEGGSEYLRENDAPIIAFCAEVDAGIIEKACDKCNVYHVL